MTRTTGSPSRIRRTVVAIGMAGVLPFTAAACSEDPDAGLEEGEVPVQEEPLGDEDVPNEEEPLDDE